MALLCNLLFSIRVQLTCESNMTSLETSVKLGTKCVVNGCENTTDHVSNLTFHRFPTHRPELAQKWMKVVNRSGFVPSRSMIVCSDHFPDDSFQMRSGKRILKANATPVIPLKATADESQKKVAETSQPTSSVRIFVTDGDEEIPVNTDMTNSSLVAISDQELPLESIQTSQITAEPTVFLIHSYANITNETDGLDDNNFEDIQFSPDDELNEMLKQDKDRALQSKRTLNSDPSDKDLKMSIAYIRF